mgnify:CR=1 FL=1
MPTAKRTPGTENVWATSGKIWLSAGSIGVLFLCLLVYLGHLVATSEQDMINNSYNSVSRFCCPAITADHLFQDGMFWQRRYWMRMKRRLETIRIRICFLIS